MVLRQPQIIHNICIYLFRTSCAPPFGPSIRSFKVLLHFSACISGLKSVSGEQVSLDPTLQHIQL